MKNDELQLLNDYTNISDTQKNLFLSNIESDIKYNTHFYKCEYDFAWLDVMKDTIQYIEKITKEPKVFILNNEEIVQVEKSKKISVESVVHLTQHSSYISKYDEKTGEVRPSKILNITREETMNIYENRFIYTLINKMVDFIESYGVLALEKNDSVNDKNLSYVAQTKRENEIINIKLNIESVLDQSTEDKEKTKRITESIIDVRNRVHDLRSSNFYKTLKELNVPEVKSPIKKTNIILKNPNFQRAEYLWHFLETYDKNIKKETKYSRNYSNNKNIENKLNTAFLINYSILGNKNILKSEANESVDEINLNYLKNNINNYLSHDTFIDENRFMKIMRMEYKKVRDRQEKDYKEIRKIIESDLINYRRGILDIREIFKTNN